MVLEGENYLKTNNVAQSTKTVEVKGIGDTDTILSGLKLKIKTSDIKNAGTNSIISGRIYFVDGTSTELTHFDDPDIDDFERNSVGTYELEGNLRAPWMINKVEIDYQKSGTSAGWHCEYVQPIASVRATYSKDFIYLAKDVEGEMIPVNQWFGAEDYDKKHVVWTGQTDSMKRIIREVGNFNDIADSIYLSNSDGDKYTFIYDGLVLDQYGYIYEGSLFKGKFVPSPYNAYESFDAPTLSITSNDKAYDNCLDYTVNSITVDKAALYESMKAKGDSEIELTVKLQFPVRSTTKETATWIRTITVTLED